MNTTSSHYDILIVGGRPAGSTLAARLGLLLVRGLTPDEAAPSPGLVLRALVRGLQQTAGLKPTLP